MTKITISIKEMQKMMELNPISFKIFMDLESDNELEKIFKDLSTLKSDTDYNGLVATHCEKKSIVEQETERLKQKEENEAIDYTYARPARSEDESVKQALELADKNDERPAIEEFLEDEVIDLAILLIWFRLGSF